MLVIDEAGDKHGPLNKQQALALAEDHNLDLYLVSTPAAGPAVAKLVNYGRMQYNQEKRARELRKKQQATHNREMRFRVNTGAHDQAFKLKKIIEFLQANQRVKISLRFRGREASHPELGINKLQEIIQEVTTWGAIEKPISRNGMVISTTLIPIKSKNQPGKNQTLNPED